MKPIFSLFWQICRLKQSPEHVPTQTWFVALVVVANLVCSITVSMLTTAGIATGEEGSGRELSAMATITGIVVGQTTTAVLTWVALQLRDLGTRFFATLTALFGCDLLITACFGALLPLLSLVPAVSPLIFLLFLIWSISVMGFILHRALQIQLPVGILVAVGFSVIGLAMSEVAIGA